MVKHLKEVSLITMLVVTVSCNNAQESSLPKDGNSNDTIRIDIAKDGRGKYVDGYFYTNLLLDKLKLDSLEKGFNELQIRIWYGYAFKDTAQLFILKNSSQNWKAQLITFIPRFSQTVDSVESVISDVRELIPSSKWETINKKLADLDIMNLPDMSKVQGNITIADGDGVSVEVATKNLYRFYQYQELTSVMDRIPEAKKMDEILRLIEGEFGFKRLR